MMKLMTCLTTALFALMVTLPFGGCQQKDQEKENRKVLDVQVDTGTTKVTVEGTKKADKNGKRFNVEVDRHPGHEHEPNDRAN
jgi:hypothetical protein